jgi:hypothetical protein
MSEKTQIEEMANVLEKAKIDALATIGSMNHGFGMWYAKALYNDGYRKQSEAEWISVEERLPDGNGRFLTVDGKGNMMTCYFGGRFGWFASVCDKNAITHWMPLPEPPKTE